MAFPAKESDSVAVKSAGAAAVSVSVTDTPLVIDVTWVTLGVICTDGAAGALITSWYVAVWVSWGVELSVTVRVTLDVAAASGVPVIADVPLELVTLAQLGNPWGVHV